MKLEKYISELSLFSGLSEPQKKSISQIAKEINVDRGQSIFSEGDKCEGFYAIITGQVRVYKLSVEGKEQILHMFGPGEIFGEVPVFLGKHFPANACATAKSHLIFIPREDFKDLIHDDPSFAMSMLAIMSQRLRHFTALIENLSLKEVPGRLAAYLIHLSEGNDEQENVQLDMSKAQLASLLGTIPETLSRILGKMTQEGILCSTGSRTMQLLNIDALEELADGERRLS